MSTKDRNTRVEGVALFAATIGIVAGLVRTEPAKAFPAPTASVIEEEARTGRCAVSVKPDELRVNGRCDLTS